MKTEIRKTEIILGILLKSLSLIASVYGMLQYLWGSGLMFFTYFTNLSNLFIDFTLLWSLAASIRSLVSGKDVRTQRMYLIKYISTVCICLTLMVFAFILAPFMGSFRAAYGMAHWGSAGVHLTGPLLAILDFFICDIRYDGKAKHIAIAAIPPLAYVGFVFALSGIFGVRWDTVMGAPYNFINYLSPTGWFGFDPSLAGPTTLGIGVAYVIPVILVLYCLWAWLMLMLLRGLRRLAKAV